MRHGDPAGFCVGFHFQGDLAKLLVRPHQAGRLIYCCRELPAVKDAIEALGIPHTEVDVIMAGGRSVDFRYQLQPDDQVDVYPFGWRLPQTPVARLIPPVPEAPRFIVHVHLGKLARRLRLLGFDSLDRHDYADEEIVRIARREGRIILTRDRGLLKRRQVVSGCLLTSEQPEEQLRLLIRRYPLTGNIHPLGRCANCNGRLQPVDKAEVADRLQPKTRHYFQAFRRCEVCGQVYWQGSHTAKILSWIEENFPPAR